MKRLLLLGTLSALLFTACGDLGLKVQTIQGLRVLGARVEQADDPNIAEPASGSEMRLRWLVASKTTESFEALLQVCEASPTNTGVQECNSEVFLEESQTGSTAQDLVFELRAPTLEGQGELLFKLVVCNDGTPSFASDGVGRCSGGEKVVEALTTASVGKAQPNSNPDLADDRLLLDGEVWEAQSGLRAGKACPEGMPRVRAGTTSLIEFELDGDDREALPVEGEDSYGASPSESLLFGHFLTQAGLARPFSSIESGKRDPSFELELELDEKAKLGAGKVADFILVVRDERGGADWQRRQLCARAK